jgi:hypothetical protein
MGQWSRWLRHAAGCTAWIGLAAWAGTAAHAAPQEFVATHPSIEASRLVDWVLQKKDARGLAFAIVDKRNAHIYVFRADGHLAGHSPVLLGSAFGDDIAPHVGEHAQTGHVPPAERTTPAGRFEASPGRNAKGENIVWVDYDSAFAIHRVRPGFSYGVRNSRLASTKLAERRVSWGCVVVPVAFYQQVVERMLGAARSVVYVMPETTRMQQVFDAL